MNRHPLSSSKKPHPGRPKQAELLLLQSYLLGSLGTAEDATGRLRDGETVNDGNGWNLQGLGELDIYESIPRSPVRLL